MPIFLGIHIGHAFEGIEKMKLCASAFSIFGNDICKEDCRAAFIYSAFPEFATEIQSLFSELVQNVTAIGGNERIFLRRFDEWFELAVPEPGTEIRFIKLGVRNSPDSLDFLYL